MKTPWKNTALDKLASVRGGKRMPKGRKLVNENTGYPYIRVADINDNGISKEDIKFVPLDVVDKISSYRVSAGDLYITVAGTIGKVGKIPKRLDGANLTENADLITNFSNEVDVDYLLYVLRSEVVQCEIQKVMTQNAQPKLALKRIRRFQIPLPPLPEQQKIAEILSTWDEAIAVTEQLIAALKKRKKGLMQRLLTGQVRFPGFDEEWRDVRLGDIFTERKEKDFENLPLLSITDSGITYRDNLDRRDTSSSDKSNYLRICPGDIGYNTMRMWQGRSSLSHLEGIVSPAYTILKPDSSVDPRFMAYLFKFRPMVYKFYRFSQGLVSDTWSLKYTNFSKIRARIPHLEEQQHIAEFFSLCDQEIELHRKRIQKIKIQKKGLMQRLLTGKIRV
jgi:type I restriction enzyme S subunit